MRQPLQTPALSSLGWVEAGISVPWGQDLKGPIHSGARGPGIWWGVGERRGGGGEGVYALEFEGSQEWLGPGPPNFRSKTISWEPLIMGRVAFRVLPKAAGKKSPQEATREARATPRAALGPMSPFSILLPFSAVAHGCGRHVPLEKLTPD